MTKIRSYDELSQLVTWDDRFAYLRLGGGIGRSTFGFDRYINQRFYASNEWKSVRNFVIVRDNSCDLGVPGYEIYHELLVHHMNPIGVNDILHNEVWIFDPNFLITTRHSTHNDIHYGVKNSYPKIVTERTPKDTKLW